MSDFDAAAQRLCLSFSDDSDIPAKYKPGKKKRLKKKEKELDTKVQQRFDANLLAWRKVVEVVYEHVDETQAKRFTSLRPMIDASIINLIDCQDFIDFHDVLIELRDSADCDDQALGKLSMLVTEFQWMIQRQIHSRTFTEKEQSDVLNNAVAQSLREQGTCMINGIEVKFWQGHNAGSVATQSTWNRVKLISEQNQKSLGESGTVVITGVLQIPRQEAWDYATGMGFHVRANVSRQTNFVVLGSENVSPSKIALALQFIEEGAGIQFMDEVAFLTMVEESLTGEPVLFRQ